MPPELEVEAATVGRIATAILAVALVPAWWYLEPFSGMTYLTYSADEKQARSDAIWASASADSHDVHDPVWYREDVVLADGMTTEFGTEPAPWGPLREHVDELRACGIDQRRVSFALRISADRADRDVIVHDGNEHSRACFETWLRKVHLVERAPIDGDLIVAGRFDLYSLVARPSATIAPPSIVEWYGSVRAHDDCPPGEINTDCMGSIRRVHTTFQEGTILAVHELLACGAEPLGTRVSLMWNAEPEMAPVLSVRTEPYVPCVEARARENDAALRTLVLDHVGLEEWIESGASRAEVEAWPDTHLSGWLILSPPEAP